MKTDKFGEAICAFANDLPNHAKPGYLFVGATPNGTASGTTITDASTDVVRERRFAGDLPT